MREITIVNFLKYLAEYYAPTEAAMLHEILRSDFVHVDETKISIQGVDHYVWVFTDGKHVVFRMTETREADIVREVLAGYQGVLVSDFYPGYDSMPCRQQKCLVHLIRDINDQAWRADLLGRLVKSHPVHVNLIPLNAAAGIPFERPSDVAIDRFAKIVADHGVTVSVRKSRGRDIRAACGQLIVEGQKKSAAQQLAVMM